MTDDKSATDRIAELEAENARLNLYAAQDRSYIKILSRLYEHYRDKAKLLERSTKPDEAAVMLRERTLKLRKAEHDRDRYKRKIDDLMKIGAALSPPAEQENELRY